MQLIKLGGSVITDKARPLTPRLEDIKRLTREIAAVPGGKIIVHGAGSFGHIKAAEYKLSEGYKDKKQSEGISLVQRDMRVLNQIVVDAFHEADVPVASKRQAPNSFCRRIHHRKANHPFAKQLLSIQ